MFKKILKRNMAMVVMAALLVSGVPQTSQAAVVASDEYQQRFFDMYEDIHDASNKYFSEEGIPYHAAEDMIVEATDYGRVTTSEAFSYYMWLEAMYGKFTGDFDEFKQSWATTEEYMIPDDIEQKASSMAQNGKPTYADEYQDVSKYPSELKSDKPVGTNPIVNELKSAYGSGTIYGMHWLLDVDDWFGFGDGDPTFINTFQRGQEESTFETIPQPCIETLEYGKTNEGFLSLFTGDKEYSAQFKYTNAPDADARAVQATYWADKWADEYNVNLSSYVAKATKMGDYLRYSMFDKYYRKIGDSSQAGTGYDSAHFLLSWYYAWGGGIKYDWSWIIGCSHSHFGYQNPMAAWILSKVSEFKPKSANGATDWGKSLDRQMELYQYLQSAEGGIAGGVSNSYNGRYETLPSSVSTFYGMGFVEHPVYNDPGSNRWFGMQAWSMQRVAELYYESGNAKAKAVLDKWVNWVVDVVKLNDDGTFAVPSNLNWSGQPDTWTGTPSNNSNLHVSVDTYSTDLGVTGSLCNALLYYAAAENEGSTYSADAKYVAKELLDRMWTLYRDDKGVSATENIDVTRIFEQEVYVPSGWVGTMPNGDVIKSGIKFLDIRSNFKLTDDYAKVLAAYNAGTTAEFNYHRFWAQCDVAIANGTYSILFGDGQAVTPTTKPTTSPTVTPTTKPTATPTATPTTKPIEGAYPAVAVTTAHNGNSVNIKYVITAQGGTIDLSKLDIVFTANGMPTGAQNVFIDNAALNLNVAPYYSSIQNSVTGSVANGALTLDITSPTQLAQGTGTLTIELRVANSDWSTYPTLTNQAVSVYYNGALVK